MKRLRRHPESRSVLLRILMLLAALAFVAVVTIACLALFTDLCRIRNVAVTGNRYLKPDYVRKLSGVDAYRNLVTLPVDRIEKNLEQDPWIERARVGRRLLHTVTIELTERKPLALINCSGACFLVDAGGYVIGKASASEFSFIPHIHGGDISVPRISGKVTDGKIRGCIGILAGMHGSLRDSLGIANPFDGRGNVFVARNGLQIVYGEDENTSKKNEMLEVVLIDIENNNRKVSYVDVRIPDSPVVR